MPGECAPQPHQLPLACALSTLPTLCFRYRYGDRIYFSSNTGSGIFEVDHTSLTAVLDRTGENACDFTTNRCAPLAASAAHMTWVRSPRMHERRTQRAARACTSVGAQPMRMC